MPEAEAGYQDTNKAKDEEQHQTSKHHGWKYRRLYSRQRFVVNGSIASLCCSLFVDAVYAVGVVACSRAPG